MTRVKNLIKIFRMYVPLRTVLISLNVINWFRFHSILIKLASKCMVFQHLLSHIHSSPKLPFPLIGGRGMLSTFSHHAVHMDLYITKTCLYSFDPLKPHFYTVKLGFTALYINFLISAQKTCLWVPVRTASPRRF